MLHLLNHCIPRYFSLDDLNYRIGVFDLGRGELSNRIPLVPSNYASKDKLKMSGSEMLSFCRFLGVLIGDRVPGHSNHWKLYLNLCELLDLCLSKRLSRKRNVTFKVLVQEFYSMYVSVTGDNLKPKMYFLLHYSTVFENCGPVDHMSTRRFASKHRTLTIPAHSTMSRKQIAYTCALRHQLVQSFRFLSREPLAPRLEMGPSELVLLSEFDNFDSFKNSLPACIFMDKFTLSCDWVNISGTVYKPGMVLVINVSENGLVFGELQAIFVKDSNVVFVYRYFVTAGFNEHIHAYAISSSSKWGCKPAKDIFDHLPLYPHEDISGDKYVVLRYCL
ncbi:hypothetical protein ONE63_011566 [Megalurothrips usitatus]|uniref:Uncharacterized protein n=1 Tax=Megalurothrips usitatus TaxID=439358 RepID=A0AAV7X467_9NEOP|nr:hypothetical protein ONE63_011566 [Megalurothrips usitatus]